MGEKVGAIVVPHPGHTVEPHELVTFAAFVRPEPLPKNPAGKVLKALLREQIQWGKLLR